MKISDVMTSQLELCTPDDSLIEAARIMARADVGIVPIVESQETRRAIGVVTDRDIVVRVVAEGKDPNVVPTLHDVMTHELITCSPNDSVEDVQRLMEQRQVRRVLVVDEHNSLVGVFSTADLTRAESEAGVGHTLGAISEKTS